MHRYAPFMIGMHIVEDTGILQQRIVSGIGARCMQLCTVLAMAAHRLQGGHSARAAGQSQTGLNRTARGRFLLEKHTEPTLV